VPLQNETEEGRVMAKAKAAAATTRTAAAKREQQGTQSGASTAAQQGRNGKQQQGSGELQGADAEKLLRADHRKVEGLFTQAEKAENAQKKTLVQQICLELVLHTKLEEELSYPACREKGVEDDDLDEAQVEHDGAAREGWEHRGGSSRSSGSSRGGSRSRDDDDDRRSSRGGSGGRGEGHGGWFGDPEGHSRASRQGWRDRD
jgi:hypothetical protein